MAIDPDNFFDEEGNIRRRDNIVAELAEGDLLIGFDRNLYEVKDGELTIYMSGKKVGDGGLELVPMEMAGELISQSYGGSFNLFDMNDLGLNIDESIS